MASPFLQALDGQCLRQLQTQQSTGRNAVARIYGAGQGHAYLHHPSDDDRDKMQDRSYVLIDAPQEMTNFQDTEVFGAGDYSGVGYA